MASTTIQWTEHTWNPIVGCSIVSPGCTNCYAMRMARRLASNPQTPWYAGTVKKVNSHAVWTGKVALVEHKLADPLRWKQPRRIFVNSMGDLFHEAIPDEWIDRVFEVMRQCPQHVFQILTKRPEHMQSYARSATVLPNAWLGVSAERQHEADERIKLLISTRAAVRFVSCEPLLGPLDLSAFLPDLDWIIVGGESGPDWRAMDLVWAKSLHDQCKRSGTAFFMKQVAARDPADEQIPRDLFIREYPAGHSICATASPRGSEDEGLFSCLFR